MIAIIKYNAGNISSVKNALDRLGCKSIITDNEQAIRKADKVILPGVGQASTAMLYLREKKLDKLIQSLTQPVLGICLGHQLLCAYSQEDNTNCIGIFDTKISLFPNTEIVPHMGWNNIETTDSPLFEGLTNEANFYFVHSYYAPLNKYSIATCHYILPFSAAMQKNNFYATQFHPEKSGNDGAKLLANFIKI